MPIKYRYVDGNQIIESLTIPEGFQYETIEYEELQEVLIDPVTPRQFRRALILSGVAIQDIINAMEQLPEPARSLAKSDFEYSLEFQRDHEFVPVIGQILGWTDQQLDDLWLLAKDQ